MPSRNPVHLLILLALLTPSVAALAEEREPTSPLDKPEMARAPQATFEALPRFGAKLFETISLVPIKPQETKPVADGAAAGKPTPPVIQPVANMPVPPGYLIGPGDTLSLRVWSRNFEQVNQTVTVSAEGFIVLPQLGRITAAGQTLDGLRQSLTQAYNRLFTDPTVTLVISEQRTVEVYVTGEAVRPGKYMLAGMATVLSALYASGGPSPIGSYRHIKLNRLGQQTIDIDLYDYLLTGRRDQDIVLAPGDTLFIPPLEGEVGLTGELRRPARYELKGALTLADALQLAGGLKPSAYGPVVHLWRADARANWALTTVDCSNPASPDLRQPLRDGDLIIVKSILPTGANTVQLMGAVKRPGYYPVTATTSVADLLHMAEGLAWNAHMGNGVVRRMDYNRHYQLLTFNVAEQMYGQNPPRILLEPKDEVEVFSQQAVEPAPEIEIKGAVAHPGKYQWAAQMRVSQLLLMAGGVLPEAYLDRVELLRLTPDQKYQVVGVNLKAALTGQTEADLMLERGDILRVLLRAEAEPPSQVKAGGYVRTPGDYPRREGMKVSDLIYAAGGLRPGAGPGIELTPGRFEGTPKPQRLQLVGDPEKFSVQPDPVLGEGDSVAVLGRGDFKQTADQVFLQGKVHSPGTYTIKRSASQGHYTVLDLLDEGGGLLDDANPNGIVVYRSRANSMEQAQTDDLNRVLQSVNRETTQTPLQVNPTDQQTALETTATQNLRTILAGPSTVTIIVPPRPVRTDDAVLAIPVSGRKLLESQGKQGNMELEPGDTVVVPRRVNVVTVLGAVPRSGAVPFVTGLLCRDYIYESGGLGEDAASDRLIVIHPNGAAAPMHMADKVEPGDIIVIPTKHIVRTVRTESVWQQWLRGVIPFVSGALIF
jgi:polysaccharide biosynthesis/export protein